MFRTTRMTRTWRSQASPNGWLGHQPEPTSSSLQPAIQVGRPAFLAGKQTGASRQAWTWLRPSIILRNGVLARAHATMAKESPVKRSRPGLCSSGGVLAAGGRRVPQEPVDYRRGACYGDLRSYSCVYVGCQCSRLGRPAGYPGPGREVCVCSGRLRWRSTQILGWAGVLDVCVWGIAGVLGCWVGCVTGGGSSPKTSSESK
jgi:hypothetical protein